jgi:serine protease AprX
MKQLLVFLLFFVVAAGFCQIAPDKYFVEFTDKNGTPYSTDHPEQFLSSRSIERRQRFQIPTTEEDLPVNPAYVNTIANLGVTVLNRTKWFNGITIYTTDPVALIAIGALPFVKKVEKYGPQKSNYQGKYDKFNFEKESAITGVPEKIYRAASGEYDYGPSYNQIHMMRGDSLHKMGYRGQGMVIAVLDAGFMHADSLPVFDSLRLNNRILGTRDFVVAGNDVYKEYSHGTSVLSTMGGNIPGTLIGTAPEASYWLFRTEDVTSENYIEEYNWVSGAEVADSVGADLINSSLGYTTFDLSQWSHTWNDLNGHTTTVTKGANMAAGKGMAVINSAGNEGLTTWRYLGAPADGDDVLAVGAVDSLGYYASFSSHGIPGNPVKPNVMAQGRLAYVAEPDSTFQNLSGTSFSSPITAGLVACLWQTRPTIIVRDLYHAIEMSASQYSAPDTLMGYGIPDFSKAISVLSVPEKKLIIQPAYPNPFRNEIFIPVVCREAGEITVNLYNDLGQAVHQESFDLHSGNNLAIIQTVTFHPGLYILKVSSKTFSESWRLIKK